MAEEHSSFGFRSDLYLWRLPARSIPMVFVASFVLAITVGPLLILQATGRDANESGRIIGSLILGYMFAGVPILVCLTQNSRQRRQLAILSAYSETGVGRTSYFRQALLSIQTFNPAALTADYVVPMLVFFWVTVFAIITIFLSFALSDFSTPSVVLGGMHALAAPTPDSIKYQMGTFAVGAAAFFGAYAYVTQRLIERTVASDLYPAVFYKYSAHILVACSVAGIVRLGLPVEGTGHFGDAGLTILGFIVGRFPNLVIGRLSRNISGKLNFLADRPEVSVKLLPAALSLQLLDDIKPETIDRLAELQVFSAFDLATRNPVLIWLTTPHDFGEIVAWLAQAQLLVLLREGGLAEARQLLVRDIFDLVIRLKQPSEGAYLMERFGLQGSESASLLETIESSYHYSNLFELREALKS